MTHFPAMDTYDRADTQMSTFACLLLALICSDHSIILLLLDVNTSFMCEVLCFISLSFSKFWPLFDHLRQFSSHDAVAQLVDRSSKGPVLAQL